MRLELVLCLAVGWVGVAAALMLTVDPISAALTPQLHEDFEASSRAPLPVALVLEQNPISQPADTAAPSEAGRELFHLLSSSASQPPTTIAESPADTGQFSLKGIFADGEQFVAIVLTAADGSYRTVRPGDSLGDKTVSRIEQDRLFITARPGGEETVFKLRGAGEGP